MLRTVARSSFMAVAELLNLGYAFRRVCTLNQSIGLNVRQYPKFWMSVRF
jgi:hypothetical protein